MILANHRTPAELATQAIARAEADHNAGRCGDSCCWCEAD